MIRKIEEAGHGKTFTELHVVDRPAGNHSLPLVVIKGASPGPTLTIVAGIHPTEYAGIEASLRLAQKVSPADVRGRILIMPFLNIAGFNSRTPGGSPEDLVDVWLAFPGRSGSSITYAVADEVFRKVILNSDLLVDLHGGELNESAAIPLAWFTSTGDPRTDEKSRALADAFRPDYLLDATNVWDDDRPSGLPNGLLIHEAAKHGVPGIIGEAGGAGRSFDEGADRLYDGLLGVARSAGILRDRKEREPVKTRRYREATHLKDLTLLRARQDGLLYSKAEAGVHVKKGESLGQIRSWEGKVLQSIEAPFDGIVTIRVNWLPVRSGEYVLAMAKVAS